MLRLKLIISGCVILLLGLLVAYIVSEVEPADVNAYERLLLSSNPGKDGDQTPFSGFQQREKLQKNVWFATATDRLQIQVLADRSQLRFRLFRQESEIEEEMKNVTAFMQEKLYYLLPDGREAHIQEDNRLLIHGADPSLEESWLERSDPSVIPMQIVRYLEADEATHSYHTNTVLAHRVTLSRFKAEGHRLPHSAPKEGLMMKGIAKSAEFSLSGSSPNFKAHQLKATFYSKGDLL